MPRWWYFNLPVDPASRWPKMVISESPWFVAQHIKARREDHRLNRIGDAIVIRLRPPAMAWGGIA
jgi:hypothetical protein